MTKNEINTLENRFFRLECEKLEWRKFRTLVEFFVENHTTFGTNTDVEWNELKEELDKIKYL